MLQIADWIDRPDRAQPSCGWCTRNDSLCEYKERKKPGLRAGYGRELETRLDRLEERLHQQELQLKVHLRQQCSYAGAGPSMLNGPELPVIDPIDPYGVQTHSIRRTSGYQQTSPSSVPDHRPSRTGSQQHFPYQATSVALP